MREIQDIIQDLNGIIAQDAFLYAFSKRPTPIATFDDNTLTVSVE